jgi:hypothetical protein
MISNGQDKDRNIFLFIIWVSLYMTMLFIEIQSIVGHRISSDILDKTIPFMMVISASKMMNQTALICDNLPHLWITLPHDSFQNQSTDFTDGTDETQKQSALICAICG